MAPVPQMSPGGMNPPAPPAGPQGSPMSQPTPNDGARQMGMVQVVTAMQMLEKALPTLGSNTPEGKACLSALNTLSTKFQRQKAEDLVPAQIQEMARAQRASPVAQMLMQQQGQQQAPQGAAPQPAPAPTMQ